MTKKMQKLQGSKDSRLRGNDKENAEITGESGFPPSRE